MRISMLGPSFLGALGGATVALVIATARTRRFLRRVVLALVTTIALLATTAASVNAYFAYYPSVASVLGQSARDAASRRDILLRIARSRLAGGHRAHALASAGVTPSSVLSARVVTKRDVDVRPTPPRPHGLVETVAIPPTASGFHARPAEVYLPPAWFASPRPALPVIELLHGTPGSPDDWTRAASADVVADAFAASHNGRAPIIVMPDVNGSFTSDTECVDTLRRHAETYLSVDVPNFVTREFGASPLPSAWAIAGSSEGGYCALDLALRHPDRWATFADFAGLDQPTYPGGAVRHLFGGSLLTFRQHTPAYLMRGGAPAGMAGWFEAGSADRGTTRSTLWSAQVARRAGMTTQVVVQRGAHHNWRMFHQSLVDAFPWLAGRLGLVGSSPPTV